MATFFSFGTSIKSFDKLQTISFKDLCGAIQRGENGLKSSIEHLREIAFEDLNLYKELKLKLPYFSAGIFKDGQRKKLNFLEATYLVFDYDGIPIELLQYIKDHLCAFKHTAALFLSPSGVGLKLILKSELINDPNQYELQYQKTLKILEELPGAEFLDSKTCDAARVCFFSFDPDIFVNTNAEKLPFETPPTKKIEEQLDVVKEIFDFKQKLNAPKLPKNVFIPEEITILTQQTLNASKELGWKVMVLKHLNYGVKLGLTEGLRNASLNVFYGKKGFSFNFDGPNSQDDHLRMQLLALVEQVIQDYGKITL